jgi:hypothetical protein
MLPSAEALHLRKVRKIFLRSLHKSFLKAVKAEERAADGRMKSPEAVTVQKAGYMRETPTKTILVIRFLAMPCTRNRRSLSLLSESLRGRKSTPKPPVFRQMLPCSEAQHEDKECNIESGT